MFKYSIRFKRETDYVYIAVWHVEYKPITNYVVIPLKEGKNFTHIEMTLNFIVISFNFYKIY